MKNKISIILICCFLYSTAKVKDMVFSVTNVENKKAVFINQKTLNSIRGNEFTAGDYELKTQQSAISFSLHKDFKVKLFPHSEVVMKVGMNANEPITFNFRKGKIYFKNNPKAFAFEIDKFFKFSVDPGDFMVEFDETTKNAIFTTFDAEQKIQVEEDDRINLLKKNHQISFTPEWSDGEIVYDFLLNNRKIPKFQLRQEPVEMSHKLADSEWKAKEKPKSKNVVVEEVNKENLEKAITQNKENKNICTKPKGAYTNCYWIKKDKKCLRFYCNLNGEWSQKTEFRQAPDCPSTAKILPCEWMN
jgi:hypothetical protein